MGSYRFQLNLNIAGARAAALCVSLLVSGSAAAGTEPLQPAGARPAAPKASSPSSSTVQADILRKATPAERATAERLDALSRAAFWSNETNIDPSDAVAGVRLATSLRQLGRFDEADSAAAKVLAIHPEDYDALLETARARISARQGFYAIQPLKLAIKTHPKDWKPVSLMGVALEQSDRPDEARAAYEQALVLSPDNPAVLSNLAMSYATKGNRAQAEVLLRRAVAQPDATIQERQNLALILGLNGHLVEAEKLIREDLPPEVAAANLAYLRSLQASPPPPPNPK